MNTLSKTVQQVAKDESKHEVVKILSSTLAVFSVFTHDFVYKQKKLQFWEDRQKAKDILRKYKNYIQKINKKYSDYVVVHQLLSKAVLDALPSNENKNIQFKIYGVTVDEIQPFLIPIMNAKKSQDLLNYMFMLRKKGFKITRQTVLQLLENASQMAKVLRNTRASSIIKENIRIINNFSDSDIETICNEDDFANLLTQMLYDKITGSNGDRNILADRPHIIQMLIISLSYLHHNNQIGDYKELDAYFV